MPISSLHLLDRSGKSLVSRNYRGDVDQSIVDKFAVILAELEESDHLKPIVRHEDCAFCYIRHNSLWIVATTKGKANAALIFAFLYKFLSVMEECLGDVNEESIRDNFVFLYELLDELLDFGYPQTTEARILQDYITQERCGMHSAAKVPMAVTNAVSWRPSNLKYDKNEVFLDVIESVNMVINAKGDVVQSDVIGTISMRVYLTGMPELRLGLNDQLSIQSNGDSRVDRCVKLDDVKFHQCVRLARFEADGTIAFVPPDGSFELMSYRLDTAVKPMFQVQCNVERHGRSRVQYRVRALSQYKRRSTANSVEITIPVPSDADSPIVSASVGSVRYQPERGGLVWHIKSFSGGKELVMAAEMRLPSVTPQDIEARPPINVKFEIPYYTTSGLQIRYLKINEKSGYTTLPWVRYITRNGDYLIRMS